MCGREVFHGDFSVLPPQNNPRYIDKTVSSSCGVKGVSVCSLFAGYIDCSLSGCCFFRADLTSSSKVW